MDQVWSPFTSTVRLKSYLGHFPVAHLEVFENTQKVNTDNCGVAIMGLPGEGILLAVPAFVSAARYEIVRYIS